MRGRLLAVLVSAAAGACAGEHGGDGVEGTTTMVIVPDGWDLALDDEDPFTAQRPPGATCDSTAITQELFGGEPGLEVWTGLCNWVSVTQPLTTTVPAGAEVTLRLWHFELTAPAGAKAHLALAIDGAPLWSKTIDIPAPSGLVRETWTMPEAASAGAPVVFHLDNHGANTYTLLEISAVW